jgi:hypothetical protein
LPLEKPWPSDTLLLSLPRTTLLRTSVWEDTLLSPPPDTHETLPRSALENTRSPGSALMMETKLYVFRSCTLCWLWHLANYVPSDGRVRRPQTPQIIERTNSGGFQSADGTFYVSKPFRSKSTKKLRATITFAPRASHFDTNNPTSGANEFRVSRLRLQVAGIHRR